MSPAPRALVITFFLLAAALTSLAVERPPAPLPASVPADVFSAERAMAHVQRLAVAPHPVGTPEHDRVRDELFAELVKLGVAPSVQRTVGITQLYRVAGAVENIVARVQGASAKGDAVLLAAHYDSVPAGPGAGDDASGVAVLLETLRALLAGGIPKNDVIFLFTDGEEEGMLGASAFVAEHPWAKDVRVVLNFEARGSGGISQLFETTPGNDPLVRALARSAPRGRGSSLGYEIYKRLPNDTDLTVLKKRGAVAMNFAFIGEWESYHAPIDDAARLDRGSLQQHGENALALARSFGDADLNDLRGGDAVFFNVLAGPLLHYPAWFSWLLSALAVAAWTGIMLWVSHRDRIVWHDVPFGGLAQLLTLVGLALSALVFSLVVGALHAHLPWESDVLRDGWYVVALCALLFAIWTVAFRRIRQRIGLPGLLLGYALDLLVLTLTVTRWLPGSGYLFAWPLLGLLAGSWIAARWAGSRSAIVVAALGLCALPAIVPLVPLLRGLHEALGFTAASAMAFALFLAVLMAATAPLLDVLLETAGRVVPRTALGAFALLSIVASRATRYGVDRPKPSMLAYAFDTSEHRAKWACFAERADPWIAQFVGNAPEKGRLPGFYPDWIPFPLLLHEAPALDLVPPVATLVDSSTSEGVRTLRVAIKSPRGGRTVTVLALGPGVLESWVDGRSLGSDADIRWGSPTWSFGYSHPPPSGFELKLRLKGTAPVSLWVVDRTSGLPEVPGRTFTPRPADSMPIHTGDQTMVMAKFEL